MGKGSGIIIIIIVIQMHYFPVVVSVNYAVCDVCLGKVCHIKAQGHYDVPVVVVKSATVATAAAMVTVTAMPTHRGMCRFPGLWGKVGTGLCLFSHH